MNLQLKKFKPESIADDKVIVFIGKRNTGKSTLVKDIMYHKKHLPAGIVLSGTEEGNHFYSEFIPDLSSFMVTMIKMRSNVSWLDSENWWVQENRIVERLCFWTIVCTTRSF